MSAFKERVGIEGASAPAKPCCGVYVQQVNRVARLITQIQTSFQDDRPSSIRELRLAIKRKQRMESWLAAHVHTSSLPGAADAPVGFEQPPTD